MSHVPGIDLGTTCVADLKEEAAMANRPTRLSPITDAVTDRRRQQLDEAEDAGPASSEEAAAADAEVGELSARRRKGEGLEGSPSDLLDDAASSGGNRLVVDQGIADPRGVTSANLRQQIDGSAAGSTTSEGGERPLFRVNPIRGVGDAPEGGDALGAPAPEGIREAPSVADGQATKQFNRNLSDAQEATGDERGHQEGDLFVFEGDGGRLEIGDNEYTFHGASGSTTVGLIQDGTFAAVQVDSEGNETVSVAANSSGKEKSTTTTTASGETTTTTTTTTPPSAPPASTPSAGVPREDAPPPLPDDPTQRVSPTGRGQEGGDVDDGEGDEIDFVGSVTGPVPDAQRRLLGGDDLEPDFGAAPTGTPEGAGNPETSNAIQPVDDADFGNGATGPEQDAFDRVDAGPLEQPADDGSAADTVTLPPLFGATTTVDHGIGSDLPDTLAIDDD